MTHRLVGTTVTTAIAAREIAKEGLARRTALSRSAAKARTNWIL